MTTIADVRERLTEVRPPGLDQDIMALGAVRSIELHDHAVVILLQPPPMTEQRLRATVADIQRVVGALTDVRQVEVRVAEPHAPGHGSGHIEEPGTPPSPALAPTPPSALSGVRDLIAVFSTKGGVGKSTVAVNLALACDRLGLRVGLMDADIYGPSIPLMLGVSGRPRASENKRINPMVQHGLRVMSVGFFLDDGAPVIWRGPLVTSLVRQFLQDVEWGELDLLIVDMPPGTGDAQLTLVQQVPLSGGVVVTTPQEVATLDVQRGIAMFQQVDAPVIGVVENMSYYECPQCAQREALFGSGGGQRIADTFGVPLLGQIPLIPELRSGSDVGKPIVADQPHHPASELFVQIAGRIVTAVDAARDAAPPPLIVR